MLSDQHVLIADDQPIIRKTIRMMLAKFNCAHVSEASNGEEARQLMLTAPPPTLILCDINMSPVNGLEFLQELRSGALGNPETPVILLTCNTAAATVEAAVSLGVSGYLTKPITSEKLLTTTLNLMIKPPKCRSTV